jgi:catechol 2,3-dioxygenase-like lactoylglutathione lyase family enzyme
VAHFKAVHPVLPARNVGEAIRYYVDRLGFRLLFQDDPHDPRYAGLRRDGVELHLQWRDEVDFAKVERLALRFLIDDVDGLYKEYAGQGVYHGGTALRDTSWGTREFAFYDLNGNALFFYRDLPRS